MIRRAGALGWALVAVGCTGNTEADPCAAAPMCPVIDAEATAGDVRVLFAPEQELSVSLDGVPEAIKVTGGEVVFVPDANDPDCLANCALLLKRLRIELATLYLVSSQDSVRVRGLEVAFKGPSLLENPDGNGSILPTGMKTAACASAENVLSAHQSSLAVDGRLVARSMTEELSLDLHVPVTVDGSTDFGCQPFHLELSGTLVGAIPFDGNPVETMP